MVPRIETDRLILRPWRGADRSAFAAMNADPEVMRFFRRPLTRKKSDALLAWMREQWREMGVCFWAVELKGGGFIGFCGLNWINFPAHLIPAVEIGWRLTRSAWGNGYATEAARASLDFGFRRMKIDEVIALSVDRNERSLAVMNRLGMRHDPAEDFDDPDESADSPNRRLVVYRLKREDWH